jgi:cyanophycinase
MTTAPGRKLVFLIGGSDAYEAMTDAFLAPAGGRAAVIALLLQGGDRLYHYVPIYTAPWLRRGVTACHVVAPASDGALDMAGFCQVVQAATAIFIGGGHTPTYHRLYATGPAADQIRRRYEQGVPIAGVSAGALLAMQHCVFGQGPDEAPRVVPGLGLVRDLIVRPHFTARQALPQMIEVMAQNRTRHGLGIDDAACAVFADGEFAGVLGQPVYEIEIEDFERRTYRIAECAVRYIYI